MSHDQNAFVAFNHHPPDMGLSLDLVGPRYWLSIAVHAFVAVVTAAMVILWVTHIDHRLTFSIGYLSVATSVLNFLTSVYDTLCS